MTKRKRKSSQTDDSGMEEAIASEWEVAQEAQDEHGGDDGYDDPGEVE